MSRPPAPARPRALVIGPLPPPPGGVGRLVEAILASPLADRWRLDVLNLSKPGQEGRPSTVTARDVAWTVVHLAQLKWKLLAARPRVVLLQSTADTGYFRDLAMVMVCWFLRVPVVLHWHGAPESPQFPGRARWRRGLFRFGVRHVRKVVLLAEPYRPFFAPLVEPRKLAVVPNFVDGAAIARPHKGAPPAAGADELRLVFVGRVGPAKGTDVLLDAVLLARERGARLALVLVGDGESPAALAAARAHPAVRQGVARLAGPLGHERFAELRVADVFVLPTRADSFPLAILEAMAAGLPVVASAVGAIPWLLDDGACGALVPPGDVAALSAALCELAERPAERARRGAAAQARQRALFDVASAAERLDEVLRAAAGLA